MYSGPTRGALNGCWFDRLAAAWREQSCVQRRAPITVCASEWQWLTATLRHMPDRGQPGATNTQIATCFLTIANKSVPDATTLAAAVAVHNAETHITQGSVLRGQAESAGQSGAGGSD